MLKANYPMATRAEWFESVRHRGVGTAGRPQSALAATVLRLRGPHCLAYNTEVHPLRRVKLEQPEQLEQLEQREQFGQLSPLE